MSQLLLSAALSSMLYALCSVGALLFALCLSAEAQQPQKIYKVGRLNAGSPADPRNKVNFDAFRQGLRDLGWVEGRNVSIEARWAGEKGENLTDLAAELVRLRVDVIVAVASPVVQAARQATATIPIVMSGSGADPVAAGFIASLARPGGNITGLSALSTELSGKRIELLKEVRPRLAHVAVLRNPAFPAVAMQWKETEAAAKSLDVRLQQWDVSSPQQIESAFSAISEAGARGVIVFSDPVMLERNRGSIIALALRHRLPTIYPWSNYVEEGGLMSYSVSLPDMHRRAATYVDKILKGAKPAELPVEQPTKFEFIINLKAAKQIGLTIPPNVLARADKVIK
jgi:putative tryptophan/tyrosine transport system substrate-binding protein